MRQGQEDWNKRRYHDRRRTLGHAQHDGQHPFRLPQSRCQPPIGGGRGLHHSTRMLFVLVKGRILNHVKVYHL